MYEEKRYGNRRNDEAPMSLEKMIKKSTECYAEKKRGLDKRTGRKLGGGGRRKR